MRLFPFVYISTKNEKKTLLMYIILEPAFTVLSSLFIKQLSFLHSNQFSEESNEYLDGTEKHRK